jgi:hypothetical protein
MRTDTSTNELANEDLERLLREARKILASPDPSVAAFSHYGVQDVASLELWVRTMEDEQRRRTAGS